jgi:hypothetical protein
VSRHDGAARAALRVLVEAAGDGRLYELCGRLGVRVLGAFGSAVSDPDGGREAVEPSDLDIAVGFRGRPNELDLIDGLIALTGYDRIDLVDVDRANPVIRAEALTGIPLYQDAPMVSAIEQMAAIAERFDTEWLRQLDVRTLT